MKTVSVVIPCRNEVDYIESCLQSVLKNQTSDISVEVLVCDGRSDDGTFELLEKLSKSEDRIKVLTNEVLFTPNAMNLGIKHASGDYVLIVGARHVLAPDYLEKTLKAMSKYPYVACVGGAVDNIFLNKTGEIIAKAMDTSFGVGAGNFRILEQETFTDTIGTPLYEKAIFDEIGLFDERLVRNQDDELNYRVIQSGKKILFTPEAKLKYYVRGSYQKLFRQYYQYGYWKVFVNLKHKTVTTIRQLFPMLWLLFLALGWLPALLLEELIYAYLGLIAAYFFLAIYFAAQKSDNILSFFSVIWVFLILHCSYGLGYLMGLWHFLVLKRKPSQKATTLSR